MNRQRAERRGRGAETVACWYLRLKGWRIVARRARVPGGEVDIVARRGRTLVFVEVKARTDLEAAALSITVVKRQRFARAARHYLARHAWAATMKPAALTELGNG